MKRRIFPSLVVAALFGSMSVAASASPPIHTAHGTELITATVIASCHVTTNGALHFADYNATGNPFHSTSADITHSYDAGSADAIMKCTASTHYDVSVPATHGTMHGTSHPAATLAYTYNVLGTFSPVDNPPFVNCPLNDTSNDAVGNSDSLAHPIHIQFGGCIEPGLWPIPDHYTGSFTFTIAF